MSNSSTAKSVVYVVDDDSDIRDGLKVLLESVGIASVCFSSTKEFLYSQHTGGANCLILDVRLPGIGGLDLQDELAKAKIKTPIIFITGHGDIPMSVRAMKAGAVDFLSKPFRDTELLQCVKRALDRSADQRRRGADNADARAVRRRHNIMMKLDAKSLPDLVRMADLLGVRHLEVTTAAEAEAGDRRLRSKK